MLRRTAIASGLGLLCLGILGWLGGCSVETACDTTAYPSASGSVLRVSAACGQEGGNGSSGAPFRTISAALSAATPGTTIVVAEGNYGESLSIPAGVSVVGIGMDKVVVEPFLAKGGILVSGTGATRITGLTVTGATGFGIGVQTAEVALSNVRVTKTNASGADQPGHGISAQGAARLDLQGCQLTNNDGVGLVAQGCGPVSIIDPLFSKNPTGTARGKPGSTVGIIDPLFLPHSVVKDNAGGGVAIIDPLFMTGGQIALQLTATDVQHNGRYGVALYGAGASLARCAIHGTYGQANDSADGLVVAPGLAAATSSAALAVQMDGTSIVTGNGRAGVLVTANATIEIGAEISLNARGGVWAQGAGALVNMSASALVAQNTMVGLAVTAGATLHVDGTRIADTVPRSVVLPAGGTAAVELADGIGIFGQAHGRISGAILSGNKRAGVVARDCATLSNGWPDLVVENTTIGGGQYAVVVNGNYPTAAVDAAENGGTGNNFGGVADKTAHADLPVQDSLCDAASACSPTP